MPGPTESYYDDDVAESNSPIPEEYIEELDDEEKEKLYNYINDYEDDDKNDG